MRKEMTIKTSVRWLPRPQSKYPGCYPIGFENMLPDILKTENYVHLFAGECKTGYRVDINPNVKPDLIADVHDLSMLKEESFDGAMADPPYTSYFAKVKYNGPYPKFNIWTKEIVRIVKSGGRIGIMNNYICPNLKGCKYEEIIVLLTRIKQYPKIVTIYLKL